jgi:hypothetical protein
MREGGPSMALFQIGVCVSRQSFTDALVRVEAENEDEAKKIAVKAVMDRIDSGEFSADDLDVDWDEGKYLEVEGVSEEDYSDMSEGMYPNPDINLTKGG